MDFLYILCIILLQKRNRAEQSFDFVSHCNKLYCLPILVCVQKKLKKLCFISMVKTNGLSSLSGKRKVYFKVEEDLFFSKTLSLNYMFYKVSRVLAVCGNLQVAKIQRVSVDMFFFFFFVFQMLQNKYENCNFLCFVLDN